MADDDADLMLWALAHGWSVKVFSGHDAGSLWRDPARRRFLVPGAGSSPGLPVISDDLRVRMAHARATAASTVRPVPAG